MQFRPLSPTLASAVVRGVQGDSSRNIHKRKPRGRVRTNPRGFWLTATLWVRPIGQTQTYYTAGIVLFSWREPRQ